MCFELLKNKKLNERLAVFCLIFAVPLLLSVTGCAGTQMTLKVVSDQQTNDRQPVCVVLRSVDYNTFLTESYQEIAEKVYAYPPDPKLTDSRIILPGETEKIKVEIPDKEMIGIYCLFKNPYVWKKIIRRPFDSKYYISLKKNRIVLNKIGFFGRRIGPESEE